MKTKDDIIKTIRNIINNNNMSIYNIANIAGINRSTLQKALSGDRNLNLRQFNSLLNVLPITNAEKNSFYKNYLYLLWDKEQVMRTETVIDILSTIESNINRKNHLQFAPISLNKEDLKSITGRQNIIEAIKAITSDALYNNSELNIDTYLHFNDDFFNTAVGYYINNQCKKTKVSVLFEFLKPDNINSGENPQIIKNILPSLLVSEDIYSFYYVYVDGYFYDNHFTPYPYYIIYPDIALLLSPDLDTLITVTDKNALANMRNIHQQNTGKANRLNVLKFNYNASITHLMSNQVSSAMYAISYEPCITCFVPPSMYAQLINDNFPNKGEFLGLLENRLQEVKETNKKYALFNAKSIKDFENDGKLLKYENTYLKNCNISQRIEVLTNILNTMNDSTVVMRAYNGDSLSVSDKFEITNVQNLYNFDILVYMDNGYVKLIDIHEPVISSYFVDFIHNILETPRVYTYEETRALIMESIKNLKKRL